MIIFLSISGIALWLIIFIIIGVAIYEQYEEYRIKKCFERVEKRRLDLLFKDAPTSIVYKDLESSKGTIIKAGEKVRIIPHDESNRYYMVLTCDYRFIEGVKPENLRLGKEGCI